MSKCGKLSTFFPLASERHQATANIRALQRQKGPARGMYELWAVWKSRLQDAGKLETLNEPTINSLGQGDLIEKQKRKLILHDPPRPWSMNIIKVCPLISCSIEHVLSQVAVALLENCILISHFFRFSSWKVARHFVNIKCGRCCPSWLG